MKTEKEKVLDEIFENDPLNILDLQDDLREEVAKRCKPQKTVAKEIGCDPSYLNLWLKGKLKLGKNKEKLVIQWLDKQ